MSKRRKTVVGVGTYESCEQMNNFANQSKVAAGKNLPPYATLNPMILYVSPMGKRCQWVPGLPTVNHARLYFEYVDARATSLDKGFSLTPQNTRLLRAAV